MIVPADLANLGRDGHAGLIAISGTVAQPMASIPGISRPGKAATLLPAEDGSRSKYVPMTPGRKLVPNTAIPA